MWTTPFPFWGIQDAIVYQDNKNFGQGEGRISKKSPSAETPTPKQTKKLSYT
jgi:hypothetical protein